MAVDADLIAIALGRAAFSVEEEQQWSMWIDDALLLIGARLGDVNELDQAKLDYVVREAVLSHIRHPEDATQVSETVGDASTSRTYRTSKGRVTILDDWWDLLAPVTQGGAFVLDVIGSDTIHQPWCSLNFGAEYCSCGADIAGFPIYELSDGGW